MRTLLILSLGAFAAAATPAASPVDPLAAPADLARYRVREVESKGASMRPLVKEGEKLLILEDYYDVNPVRRREYVAYTHPAYPSPVGKIACGVPGDRWAVEKSRILVDGKPVANSAGKVYRLSEKSARLLSSYARSYPLIPKGVYLLLGDGLEEGIDSRTIGLIGKDAVVGRIVRRPR